MVHKYDKMIFNNTGRMWYLLDKYSGSSSEEKQPLSKRGKWGNYTREALTRFYTRKNYGTFLGNYTRGKISVITRHDQNLRNAAYTTWNSLAVVEAAAPPDEWLLQHYKKHLWYRWIPKKQGNKQSGDPVPEFLSRGFERWEPSVIWGLLLLTVRSRSVPAN